MTPMPSAMKYRLKFVSWSQDSDNSAYVRALHTLVLTAMLQKDSHCFTLDAPSHVSTAGELAQALAGSAIFLSTPATGLIEPGKRSREASSPLLRARLEMVLTWKP